MVTASNGCESVLTHVTLEPNVMIVTLSTPASCSTAISMTTDVTMDCALCSPMDSETSNTNAMPYLRMLPPVLAEKIFLYLDQ